jgi:AcrR family transcriptional regulator
VATRSYDMAGRKQAQAAARSRAVAAACELLSGKECDELTFESVAAAAGVTRVTLYNYFGSRVELLLAVFRELGRRMRAERIRDAIRESDAEAALERLFVESTRAWQRERLAVSRVFALSVFDAELGRAVARAERKRRASLRSLARRLADAGVLGSGTSAGEATQTLGALTSFQAFDAFSSAGTAGIERRLLELARRGLGIRATNVTPRKRRRR